MEIKKRYKSKKTKLTFVKIDITKVDLLRGRTSVKKGGRVALFCGLVEKNKLVQQTQMCNYIATNNFIISLLKSIYVI